LEPKDLLGSDEKGLLDLLARDGLCAKDSRSELWFPTMRMKVSDLLYVKSVCAKCPVKIPCRTYGMTQEAGIWGGLTQNERAELLRESKDVSHEV
jgi:hypothetical protein